MKHITNIRELRQMRCEGSELCEVVSITIGDLERIAEVAEANLRDKFAIAALSLLPLTESIAYRSYVLADQMLEARQ